MTETQTSLDRRQFFIGGAWADPIADDEHHAIEAATEQMLGVASLGGVSDIDAAVRAAREALDRGPWGRMNGAERAAVMRKFADALNKRADSTAQLVTRENGCPITISAMANGAAPGALLNMYADIAENLDFESGRPSGSGGTIVRREPVGVVAAIMAFNGPQIQAMFKIAPALAAGCTVVLKPPVETALDPYVIGEAALEAGLPPGVLNIVVGDREAGASLVSHPLVDKVSFTGSTAAGRAIAAECGRLIRRVTLELGGKSAALVLDDVDLGVLRQGIEVASFLSAGQNCTTQSRILAPRSRYAEVLDVLSQVCREFTIGDPLDPSTTFGPMASREHMDRVLRYIEIGKQSSGRLMTGGGRPASQDRGWFVEPTVFADVQNHDQIAREEVFGPVIVVIPYDGEEQGIALANDSNFGLAASVWTADEQYGIEIARQLRVGTAGVNYYNADLGAPFGGMKDSGLGRELGPEGIDAFLEYKSIFVSAEAAQKA